MIDAFNFAEVILNNDKFVSIVFQARLSSIEALSIPPKLIIAVLFFMHQMLDVAILPRFICKSAALPKGQIAP